MAYAEFDDYEEQLASDVAPCEFCEDLFPINILLLHQSGCRPDLLHWNDQEKNEPSRTERPESLETLDIDNLSGCRPDLLHWTDQGKNEPSHTEEPEGSETLDIGYLINKTLNPTKSPGSNNCADQQKKGGVFSREVCTDLGVPLVPRRIHPTDSTEQKNDPDKQSFLSHSGVKCKDSSHKFKNVEDDGKNVDCMEETVEKLLKEFDYFQSSHGPLV